MEIPPPTLQNVLFNEACQRRIISRVCCHMKDIGNYTCAPLLGEEIEEVKPRGAGHQTSASFLASERQAEHNIDFLDFAKLATTIESHEYLSNPLFLTWMVLWCLFVSDTLRQEIKEHTPDTIYEMYFVSFEDRMSTAILGDINYQDRDTTPIATQEAASVVTGEWMIFHQIQNA